MSCRGGIDSSAAIETQFRFLRAACLANLKGSVGFILAKASVMRVSIPSTSHFESYIDRTDSGGANMGADSVAAVVTRSAHRASVAFAAFNETGIS